jgi:hypothetical protein
MDNGQPVTKAELDAAVGDLNAAVGDLRSVIYSQKDELVDAMRQIETNLLTEFHRYAKGQNARVHNVEVGESDLKLRLSVLEDRVLSLETRLPPSAS